MIAVAETLREHPRPGSNSNGQIVAAPLVSRSSRGNAQGNSPGHNADGVIAYGLNTNRGGNADVCLEEGATPPITNSHGNPGDVMLDSGVRRLTPVECERLQALPDGWTDLGGTPDSRRYSALGDAVTASVGYWIGCRL